MLMVYGMGIDPERSVPPCLSIPDRRYSFQSFKTGTMYPRSVNGDNYPKSRISNNAFGFPSPNGYLQYNSVLRYLADGRGEYRNAANGS